MWVLLAVAIVVIGFALRINSMLVVAAAGVAAGLLGGISPVKIVEAFGTGFASSRSVSVFIIVLPVIGLLERYGLMQQARRLMGKLKGMTAGRLLVAYLALRQATAALGLAAIGGPAQAVRPLIVPMAEAAVERSHPRYTTRMREKLRSYATSADNIGLFFGEDVFIAIGSILLITGFVDATYGLKLEAIQIALWSIPTAILAFLVHTPRLLLLDRSLASMAAEGDTAPADAPTEAGEPAPTTEGAER
ncbi:DUF969 domain-containing protein [Luteococcus sp. H138]|uniref:DUF969 domain-containing protein n=1 Tax=unclassified Luteococcus TaxID=2639923 RepID=UPI00313E7C23